jgi:hypothetical protein
MNPSFLFKSDFPFSKGTYKTLVYGKNNELKAFLQNGEEKIKLNFTQEESDFIIT